MTWLQVRLRGGRLVLRIDDLDQSRVRDKYIDDIFYALDWLELDYDLGPTGVEDFKTQFSQTLRISEYHAMVDKIRTSVETFHCQCSRKDIERLSADRHCQGICRELRLSQMTGKTVLRLVTDDKSKSKLIEDGKMSKEHSIHQSMPFPVLIKKDGVPTYQVASLTDDTAMKVNFLVRGKDLWTSSLIQVFLADIAGLEGFSKAQFLHHDLMEGTDQIKLSKSQSAPAYEKTKSNKVELISRVGQSIGISEQVGSLQDLLKATASKTL